MYQCYFLIYNNLSLSYYTAALKIIFFKIDH